MASHSRVAWTPAVGRYRAVAAAAKDAIAQCAGGGVAHAADGCCGDQGVVVGDAMLGSRGRVARAAPGALFARAMARHARVMSACACAEATRRGGDAADARVRHAAQRSACSRARESDRGRLGLRQAARDGGRVCRTRRARRLRVRPRAHARARAHTGSALSASAGSAHARAHTAAACACAPRSPGRVAARPCAHGRQPVPHAPPRATAARHKAPTRRPTPSPPPHTARTPRRDRTDTRLHSAAPLAPRVTAAIVATASATTTATAHTATSPPAVAAADTARRRRQHPRATTHAHTMDAGAMGDPNELMDRIQAQVHAQISEGFREQVRRNAPAPSPPRIATTRASHPVPHADVLPHHHFPRPRRSRTNASRSASHRRRHPSRLASRIASQTVSIVSSTR